MKSYLALSLLLYLATSGALAAPADSEPTPDKKATSTVTAPAQAGGVQVESRAPLKLQALPKSNVLELEPIKGNLGPLPKVGRGWGIMSPIPGVPGGMRDAMDPYFGRGASPGPRY